MSVRGSLTHIVSHMCVHRNVARCFAMSSRGNVLECFHRELFARGPGRFVNVTVAALPALSRPPDCRTQSRAHNRIAGANSWNEEYAAGQTHTRGTSRARTGTIGWERVAKKRRPSESLKRGEGDVLFTCRSALISAVRRETFREERATYIKNTKAHMRGRRRTPCFVSRVRAGEGEQMVIARPNR